MLRIERELPGLPQFNLPFAYRLKGPLNVTALKHSLVEVVRRHDSLRTGFAWRDEEPVAFITPPAKIKLSLVTENLAGAVPIRNPRANALLRRKARLAAEYEFLKPFDLSRAPLFRARLLRLGADDHVLLLVIHDIVIDGWSMGVFMQEVAQLYAAFTTGKQAQLPQPVLRFPDFVRWQRQWTGSAAANRQFGYWRRQLRNAPPLFAASDREKASDRDKNRGLGVPMTEERLHVPKNVLARAADLSHSRGATLFVTLLAAFKALLLLRTAGSDICVATAMANRAQPGAEDVIGPFATTAIIRTRIDADTSFHEALDRVRNSVLQAYAHQELPFDELADRLAQQRGFDPELLIQVYFVLQIAFRRPIKLPGVTVRPFGYREGQSAMPLNRTWLTMTLNETPSGIVGACSYRSDLSSSRGWVNDYNSLLAKVAANPRTPIGRFADDLKIQAPIRK